MEEKPVESIIFEQRLRTAGFSSMRELERHLNVGNGAIRKFLQRPKPSLVTMIAILEALRFECDSPEMLLIKQICASADLKSSDETNKISSVQKRTQNKRKVQVMFNISRFRSVA